jgi:hypothetical protein
MQISQGKADKASLVLKQISWQMLLKKQCKFSSDSMNKVLGLLSVIYTECRSKSNLVYEGFDDVNV